MAEMVARAPIDYDTGPAICFPNQARFHPLKYLAGVAEAIKERRRANLHQHARRPHRRRREGEGRSRTHNVRADAIVVATNTPINDMVAIHTKQAPYMTYVIGARVPKGSVTDALYWDTLKAYHYVRIQPMQRLRPRPSTTYDLLIVGGEDHKTGQADDTDAAPRPPRKLGPSRVSP